MNRITYILIIAFALCSHLTSIASVKSQPVSWNDFSKQLRFGNSGTVSSDMEIKYATVKPIFYVETDDKWFAKKEFEYLHLLEEGKAVNPPSGIRSSVPLGGIGAGTVELRADGRLRDWNIFNNMPFNAGKKKKGKDKLDSFEGLEEVFTPGKKTHVDDAFMGLRVKGAAGSPVAVALRTAPLKDQLPSVQRINYSGAYPVSRLAFSDDCLSLEATLYAYSEFRIRDAARSATPCVLFSLELRNPTREPMDASFLFNMPNSIGGTYSAGEGLTLTRSKPGLTHGSMTFAATGADKVTYGTGGSVSDVWADFEEDGQFTSVVSKANYGVISASARIEPGQTRVITIAMAWYFPDRLSSRENFPIKGNYYSNLFESSSDVAKTVLGRLPETWSDLLEWQRACFDNSLPKWFQDALVNGASNIAKIGLWGKDGKYYQWESFSCPNIEPIHVTLARALPFMFFFPELEKQIIRDFGPIQQEDGYVTEKIWSRMTGRSRILGDCSPVFIFAVQMIYQWTGDEVFFNEMWPHVKRAVEWQIERSQQFGLPNHMKCTYDLSGFDKYSVLGYNGVMHIAGLKSAISMGTMKGDHAFVDQCEENLRLARKTLSEKLWNGSFYPCYWDEKKGRSDMIHTDVLYGQLWAYILGLGEVVPADTLKSHLAMEEEYANTPYGLRMLVDTQNGADPNGRTKDDTIWQIANVTWSGLNFFLGNEDMKHSLSQTENMVKNWSRNWNDQWNYTGMYTAWDGGPYCNSHYDRHLMFWSFPLAMTGQNYSAVDKRLSFDPKQLAPYRLPFYTPTANGVLETMADGSMQLQLFSGELNLTELVIGEKTVGRDLSLKAGDKVQVNR
ncbi:GH116 family glycosyl-hydrolase [Pontiella sulfatireligans]|uniref:Glycosyl-hydrolase family 116 catalytic region domain-containing protein n=1 Tax=Pontiella sulfatireligans TaxID=2750658 RepID=A0A6C2UHP7_9BACT|nr:GH116 family glycosyl-hydrolase [Pontiella sulfatireligans]VGO18736.1 hypothetical protein SCARR_00789 [Pontiella sulfatireligans]